MAYTKRCFDNVGALSSRNPDVLRKLLSLFPGYASIRKLDISSAELDIPSVRDALMSDEIPEALDELLYFSSALGSSTGWAMIEQQAGEDGIPLPKRNADFDDADMAVLAAIQDWPKYSSLLEKANARARIHGKSVYKYYAPASAGQKQNYRNADAASLAEAEETLRQHFVEQGYIRAGAQEKAVRIIPYDYAKEIWFLICYADTKKRFRGCQADGEWKNFDFNPEQYDAVVYNKVYGDIRMNTKNQRKKDHAKYRLAVGRMLLNDGGAFLEKKKIVTLRPLESVSASSLFATDDIQGLASIEPVQLDYAPFAEPRSYTVKARKDSSLRIANRLAPRLVPEDATVTRAVFEYRIKDSVRRGRLALAAGNKVDYERDGDSLVLEKWLRQRGFVLSFMEESAHGVSGQEAA